MGVTGRRQGGQDHQSKREFVRMAGAWEGVGEEEYGLQWDVDRVDLDFKTVAELEALLAERGLALDYQLFHQTDQIDAELWQLLATCLVVPPTPDLRRCLPSPPSPRCPPCPASQWRRCLPSPPQTTRLPLTPSPSPRYQSNSRRLSVSPSSVAIRFISLRAF